MNETKQANDKAAVRSVDQASATAGFRRVLLVVDESSEARAAARYADDVARQFAGTVATLTVTEAKARQRAGRLSGATRRGRDVTKCAVSGPTVGARSHTLAEEVARSAEGFGADVVVLGLSRSRLARHRLAPSLRALVAQATEVPVLLAPAAWGDSDLSDADASDTDASDTDASDTDHDVSALSAERTGPVPGGRYARV
jgi:nucleotide-binding universal stress UspA family protein